MSSSIPSTFDSAALAQLKFDARVNPDAEAKQVSRQFEAVFINQLLQSMRKATFKSELFQSDAKKTYESLFDREIANQISSGQGIGLAQEIERQLFEMQLGAMKNPSVKDSVDKLPNNSLDSYRVSSLPLSGKSK
jgi:flagellar protein FlgJ